MILEDSAILAVDSPRNSVNGVYAVVCKNEDHNWAIVALDWKGHPALGIRWFEENGPGHPSSRGCPIWFIVPNEILSSILNGLPLDFKLRKNLESFFNEEITGNELKDFVENHPIV